MAEARERMTPERWAEIVAIFEEASRRPAAERAAYLDASCADPDVRAEVDSLLANAGGPDSMDQVVGAAAASALGARTRDLVGTRLGAFRIDAERGRGGMGVVYRAVDERLGRTVALKLLPPELASDDTQRARFLREARVAATLNHPNIATVYEAGEVDGRVFIAMEYVEGRSLRERLGDGRPRLDEALAIARQVLAGLAAAHAAGITHRDLKPDNVMLTRDATAKVLDFGLARHDAAAQPTIEADTVTHAPAAAVRGTPAYMSPEQARGQPVDRRSDLFSFGAMFYELVTGTRPFGGSNVADVLSAVLRDEPPPARARNPEVPEPVSAAIARCLAKDPAARPGSCAELLELLAAPVGGRRRRRWIVVAAVVAVAVIGAGVLGWARVRSRRDGSAPVAMTGEPLPPTPSRAARAAYAAAIQSFHDANWGAAIDNLERAIAADPGLASAHWRLAVARVELSAAPTEIGASYARAVQGRDQLPAREWQIVEALEPLLDRAPPDRGAAIARLSEVAERQPSHAETWWLLAVLAGQYDRELALRAGRRATELDPTAADPWYVIADVLANRGQPDAAIHALTRCNELSPHAADCLGAKARIEADAGRCAEALGTLQRAFAAHPSTEWVEWVGLRGDLLHALGRPADTVLEAMRPRWQIRGSGRDGGSPEVRRYYDQARVAIASGDLDRAAQLVADGRAAAADDHNAETHLLFARLEIELALEAGRTQDAVRVATEMLDRLDVWVPPDLRYDPTVSLWRLRERAGAATAADVASARAAWLAKATPRLTGDFRRYLWLNADARGITTHEDAVRAVAALDATTVPDLPAEALFDHAERGRVELLAGRVDAALPRLERLARSCMELDDPIAFVRLLEADGEALEAAHRTSDACRAYAGVIARWGRARSVTADRARARAAALRCPAP